MEEEHEVFHRSARKQSVVNAASAPAQPVRTGPPAHVPVLRPDMSLWGSGPTTASTTSPDSHRDPAPPPPAIRAPPQGKKFMSLEEVEAEILAMNSQKPPALSPQSQFQPPPVQHPPPQQMHQYIHQQPEMHQQHQQHQQQAFPMHIQNMLQRGQPPLPLPLPQHHQHQEHLRGPPPRMLHEQPLQESRNAYGMATHAPASQLQNMNEAERARFLEEESKRLKRNHKIAQLVTLPPLPLST